MIFALLAAGFTTTCYDGQNVFDTDHPVTDASGANSLISNMQAGSGPACYLLDISRAIRPMIQRGNRNLAPENTRHTETKNNAQGLLAAIAKLLKLPEGSAEADVLNVLAEKLVALPDPDKFVPIDAVQDMMRDRAAKMAAMSETEVQRKVEHACKEGYITHGMRDWATALCTADPASFDSFLSGVGPTFAYVFKPHPAFDKHPAARPSVAMQSESEAEELLCRQLGLKSGSLSAR